MFHLIKFLRDLALIVTLAITSSLCLNAQATPESNESRIEQLNQELALLDKDLSKLGAEKNALQEFSKLVFWLVGGIVGFISIASILIQWLQGRSAKRDTSKYLGLVNEQNKKLNEQLEKYQEYLQNQDKKLPGTFR